MDRIHKGTQVCGDVEVSTAILVKTKECERLVKIADESQRIGAFLDWLQNERRPPVTLGVWDKREENLRPIRESIHDLLAEYFDIDQAEVERERRALLEAIRR